MCSSSSRRGDFLSEEEDWELPAVNRRSLPACRDIQICRYTDVQDRSKRTESFHQGKASVVHDDRRNEKESTSEKRRIGTEVSERANRCDSSFVAPHRSREETDLSDVEAREAESARSAYFRGDFPLSEPRGVCWHGISRNTVEHLW